MKACAAAVSAAVLGAQLWAMLPPGGSGKEWYWPFVDYPMYASAPRYNQPLASRELLASGCEPDRQTLVMTPDLLRVPRFRLWELLRQTVEVPVQRDSAMRQLEVLAISRAPHELCRLMVVERIYLVGPGGLQERHPPAKVALEWPLERTTRAGQ